MGSSSREVAINAVTEFAPAPETQPLLPTLSASTTPPPRIFYDQRNQECLGGGGVQDPQWVTAERFNGPSDYRLVEGPVDVSKVSSQDNFLNHDSQDVNWDVKPDLPFAGFLNPDGTQREMEMEWETDHYAREFRPTAGDRASTVGYWILDCGHEPFKTEVHPPVGTMVERARSVSIPSTFRPPGFANGLGTNLQVPGIATDIWFNRTSGETTNNCSDSALHQPSVTANVNGHQVRVPGPCIREPHSLNRKFTFNVYIPRDPQLRAQEVGLNPPPVPLFVGFEGRPGGAGGPNPTFVVRRQGTVTWVEATVDLRGFTGTTYARRINVAWAYPRKDNWGAKRWHIHLKDMHIYDDAEPAFDDGDWRFFFNTNNRDREWTTLFSCEGCVDDGDDRTLNFSTGILGGSSLGPDPVLFPGQPILLHTGGFDDEVYGDDIGTVFDRLPQQSAVRSTDSQGGDGAYRLNYDISPGPPVAPGSLTPEGQALIDAYTVKSRPPCTLAVARASAVAPGTVVAPRVCGPVAPFQRDVNLTQTNDPAGRVLRGGVLRSDDFELFESDLEEYVITGIPEAKLKVLLTKLRASDPKRFNSLLAEIRTELGRVPLKARGDYSDLVASLDQALPGSLVARALPTGFRKGLKPFTIQR